MEITKVGNCSIPENEPFGAACSECDNYTLNNNNCPAFELNEDGDAEAYYTCVKCHSANIEIL